MYSIDSLKRGIQNPEKIVWEFNWLYHRKIRGKTGMNVMEKDWDNLVILDACRYDMFQDISDIEGELNGVISKGSTTGEFLQRNFNKECYPSCIYISANPHVQNYSVDKKFFSRKRLWETHWHNDLGTVHPTDVVSQSIKIAERYPNKRYIIHFIQPHYPFIGDTGKDIKHRSMTGDGKLSNERELSSVWEALENGDVSKKKVWKAYRENLSLTLPHIEDLLDELGGKTVVTSDHGNVLGRWGVYGHPGRKFLEELVRVPWLEIDTDDRRRIEAGELKESTSTDSTVEDRLADLGYK